MRGRIDPLKPLKRARLEEEGNQQNELSITARLKQAIQEQEQTFVRLVEERRTRVRRVEDQLRDTQAQLVNAQRKLAEAEAQLTSFRNRNSLTGYSGHSYDTPSESEPVKVKAEPGGGENNQEKEQVNGRAFARKPVLVIPGDKPNGSFVYGTRNPSTTEITIDSNSGVSKSSVSEPAAVHIKSESGSSSAFNTAKQTAGSDSKDREDLVLHVGGSMAPSFLTVLHHHYFPSQHKRRLRSLCMNLKFGSNPTFATSALDGVINTWKVKDKGEGISLNGSVHCLSSGQKRWPEDLAWHPSGESIFACYSADANDDQVAIINPSADDKVKFLKDKPHGKGIVNSLVFLPWKEGTFFSTAGCDHGVVLWKEMEDGHWKAETLHRSLHSSAVMSAVGMQHKPLIMSVGMDKRIVGFDTEHVREEFRYTLDSKALRMLPNPVDWNLYMVQTGTPGQQLRLFDVRSRRCELHAFGWRQENTESQSALIHQSWSPDGFYIASGSADPRIHVFDIRYNSKEPSQSIKAHQKRVFKAVWHHTLPLLISISSDLNIGLVKLSK
eukprot:c23444_g1_i1 orf=803-2461(+)